MCKLQAPSYKIQIVEAERYKAKECMRMLIKFEHKKNNFPWLPIFVLNINLSALASPPLSPEQ